MGEILREERADKGSDCTPTMNCDGGYGGALVGCYVSKNSSDSRRLLVGKVASFDEANGLYGVVYEDGHREELDHQQIRHILMVDDCAPGSSIRLTCKKRKLDQLAASFGGDMNMPAPSRPRKNISDVSDGVHSSSLYGMDSDLSEDADSSSNSCDYQQASSSTLCPELQVLQLPPSSGDIAVPDESISHLFSVYNFLRSFSVQLFLSPFTLDDFVGSLNCVTQNCLFDAIHVSLMQALMHHLQMLSSEGSELASRCLRFHDWSLLDALTWPVFLVEYLYMMGYMKGFGGKEFCIFLSDSEYYGLPVETKLKVLQILCDDVIDSAELRTELESRESMEEEMEDTLGANVPQESRSSRVETRSSNTYANEITDALQETSELNKPIRKLETGLETSKAATDGNSDECRLCGMDGTLICCDGCPSAYHSRCIGLNKQFLPDGLWFCPECVVDKIGPTSSRIGRGTKGAEVFGIDAHGKMFLGTCSYLLVNGTSLNAEPLSRYYNRRDVVKVLNLITSAPENALLYADICEGITKYWELPTVIWQSGSSKPIDNYMVSKKHANCIIPFSVSAAKDATGMRDNYVRKAIESIEDNEHRNQHSVSGLMDRPNFPEGGSGIAGCDLAPVKMLADADETMSSSRKDEKLESLRNCSAIPVNQARFNDQLGNDFAVVAMSCSNLAQSTEKSTVLDISSCASTNENESSRVNAGSSCFSLSNDSLVLSNGSRHGSQLSAGQCRDMGGRTSSVLASFKPQAYVNQYLHGDIAASAAANLAVLASEESKTSESHASTNPRKTVASSIALQMKAFSGAVMQFQWPSFDKKLVDIPRERCGWCIACKGAVTNKKGCFLNLAAMNAIKRSARNISVVRPIKPDDSQYVVIASHIENMEKNLHGLLIGSFLNSEYSWRWRKRLREAFNCSTLKVLLLELEKNIRGIAFSGGWFKLVNDEPFHLSASLVGTSRTGTNQKRGHGGRRSKKCSVGESAGLSSDNSWKDVQWWRGGKLSRVVFQKGVLPSLQVKRAARQGGFRRISGICYTESSNLPKRTRQMAWRASVQMSKNASQLALQVRFLDAHIRWKDLVHTEPTFVEGKASEVDTSAFRNAIICDKKVAEAKIIYGLTFPNQKHLPLRVSKTILEKEDVNGENSKLWFSENHIPLYLVKEYEEKVGEKALSQLMKVASHTLTKFQRKQLKSRWGDIFSYLAYKRDQPRKSSCASCKGDVFLRDAAPCGICQVNCHKDCLIPLIDVKVAGLPYIPTCKICYHVKIAEIKASREILNSQLPSQRQNIAASGAKSVLQAAAAPSVLLAPLVHHKAELHPKKGFAVSASTKASKNEHGKCQSYGLIWKRKKGDDSGQTFRQLNIIAKNKGETIPASRPICCLCRMPYHSDLMYICCEKCQNWYHADALQFDVSQISDLVGFKCCKCRRKVSPQCPYKKDESESFNNNNVLEGANDCFTMPHTSTQISRSVGADSITGNGDPLYSFGIVEPILEQIPETEVELNGSNSLSQSHQKLSVRRAHEKQSTDLGFYVAEDANPPTCTVYVESPFMEMNNASHGIGTYNISATDTENINGPSEVVSASLMESDFPESGDNGSWTVENADHSYQYYDTGSGGFGDVEYEPQTYFSFTELLASDDGQLDDSYGDQTNANDGFASTYDKMPAFNELITSHVDHASENSDIEKTVFSGPQCSICKLNQPCPALSCEICGQRAHFHCSPWMEDGEASGELNWRCVNCRDWR